MSDLPSFDALLVALHDSLAGASEATRVRGEPDWIYRLREHGLGPRLAEVWVSFDCELHELPRGLCVRIARRRRWRRRPLSRVEIQLRAGEPIETTVLIDGHVLRTQRGRPSS